MVVWLHTIMEIISVINPGYKDDASILLFEKQEIRLADKGYVSRLPGNILKIHQKQIEIFARYEAYMAAFDSTKSPVEIGSIVRCMASNARELAAFCKDFDTVLSIKEQHEHWTDQLKKKLSLYDLLFKK